MKFNCGKECKDCKNCWLRKVSFGDTKSSILQQAGFMYDIYCKIDDSSLGSLHNTKAVLCDNFVEKER